MWLQYYSNRTIETWKGRLCVILSRMLSHPWGFFKKPCCGCYTKCIIMVKRSSLGNSWALDSTFKTNQYDL